MSKKETGIMGEKAALEYLLEKGFERVCENFSCSAGELDIIVKNEKSLVFVEVKTRTEGYMVAPCMAVGAVKQRHIIAAAYAYLAENSTCLELRFDVIEVIKAAKSHKILEIRQIENAFELPSGEYSFI